MARGLALYVTAFLGRGGQQLIIFAETIVLAKLLEPAGVGQVLFLIIYGQLASLVAAGGFSRVLLRTLTEQAGRPERAVSLTWLAILIAVPLLVLFGGLTLVVINLFEMVRGPDAAPDFYWGYALIFAMGMTLGRLVAEVYRSLDQMFFSVCAAGLAPRGAFVMGLLILGAVATPMAADALIMLAVCQGVVTGVFLTLSLFALRRRLRGSHQGPSGIGDVRGLMSFGSVFYATLVQVISFFQNQGDIWFANLVLDPDAFGAYTVVSRLAKAMLFTQLVAQMTLPRVAVTLHQKGDVPKLEDTIFRTIAASFVLSTTFAGGVFVFADPILTYLYGPTYAEWVWVLRIMLVGLLLFVVFGIAGFLVMQLGYERRQLRNNLIGLGATLAGVLALQPVGFTYAIPLGASVGWLTYTLCSASDLRRFAGVSIWPSRSKVLRVIQAVQVEFARLHRRLTSNHHQ